MDNHNDIININNYGDIEYLIHHKYINLQTTFKQKLDNLDFLNAPLNKGLEMQGRFNNRKRRAKNNRSTHIWLFGGGKFILTRLEQVSNQNLRDNKIKDKNNRITLIQTINTNGIENHLQKTLLLQHQIQQDQKGQDSR